MVNLALLIGMLNGIGDFLIRLSAGRISPLLGSILLSLSAAAVPAFYVAAIEGYSQLWATREGIAVSIASGTVIGIAATLFFVLFNRGAAISQIQPVVKTSVMLTAVTGGVLILRENLNSTRLIGILFALAAVILLSRQ